MKLGAVPGLVQWANRTLPLPHGQLFLARQVQRYVQADAVIPGVRVFDGLKMTLNVSDDLDP